jgi:lysophospholipase L1-like esterase
MKPIKTKSLLWLSLALNLLFAVYGTQHVVKKYKQAQASTKSTPYWYYKNAAYWQERKSLFESLPNDTGEILFVGDSQTDGCEWRELLGNASVRNRGIDGDNTEGILARLDEITASKPNRIFLEIGTNDLALKRSLKAILTDYATILDSIARATPSTVVFVQSVLPRYDDPDRAGGVSNDSIRSLNRGLQSLAQEKGVGYIDLFSRFVDEKGKLNTAYSLDGVHLNAAGYQLWKSVLVEKGCLP